MEKNRIYKFLKTGNLYYVFDIELKSKQLSDGEWVESVLYKSLDDGALYSREKRDFLDKFMLVEIGN